MFSENLKIYFNNLCKTYCGKTQSIHPSIQFPPLTSGKGWNIIKRSVLLGSAGRSDFLFNQKKKKIVTLIVIQ